MATDNPLNDNFRQFRMEYDKRIAANFVAKQSGKQLSTEDFTTAEKQKLASLTGGASTVSYSDATTTASGLMSANDKTKLNGIDTNAQVNVIESIKIDGSTLHVNNKVVDISLSGKVDKVNGKQLSTEDYTTAEKNKLAAINTSQFVTVVSGKQLSTNDYTDAEKNKLASISVTNGNVDVDTSLFVLKENGKGLSTNDFTDAEKNKLASLTSGVSYSDATTTASGLMSKDDKISLNQIATKVLAEFNEVRLTGNDADGQSSATDGGTIYLQGGNGKQYGDSGNGGIIKLNGGTPNYGASASLYGDGGSIDLRGYNGGLINLSAYPSDTDRGNGGTIDLSPNGSIKGDIYFSGTPTFLNGANGLSTTYTLPTASTSIKGGIKVGNGLTMTNEYLGLASTISVYNNVSGGRINLTGITSGSNGGVIDLSGVAGSDVDDPSGVGGTILASGSAGGVIDLTPDGSIKGNIFFTDTPTFLNGANGLSISGGISYSEATSLTSGLMSANDKIKLDGIDTSKFVTVVSGKGLSTEDYTTADKNKLASLTGGVDSLLSSSVYIPSAAFDSIMANFTA